MCVELPSTLSPVVGENGTAFASHSVWLSGLRGPVLLLVPYPPRTLRLMITFWMDRGAHPSFAARQGGNDESPSPLDAALLFASRLYLRSRPAKPSLPSVPPQPHFDGGTISFFRSLRDLAKAMGSLRRHARRPGGAGLAIAP